MTDNTGETKPTILISWPLFQEEEAKDLWVAAKSNYDRMTWPGTELLKLNEKVELIAQTLHRKATGHDLAEQDIPIVYGPKPKPRPWTVGDRAIPKPGGYEGAETQNSLIRHFGEWSRQVTHTRERYLSFGASGDGYDGWFKDRFIRVDEHGNPDPEQPEE
jgi:hypothetical protein